MPDGLKSEVNSMGVPQPRPEAGDALVGVKDERASNAQCTAAPVNTTHKQKKSGEPSAWSTCGHRLYGDTKHCGSMLCSNYKEKCPVHRICLGGG